MVTRISLVVLFALGLGGPVAAQLTSPMRIRGTIQTVNGTTLDVTTRAGAKVEVAVTDATRISLLNRTELSAIGPGAYVGTTARPGPDGQLQALEVHVFPEAARGTGEGHYGWDLTPDSTMTNATVTAAVESTSGRELSLSYKGGNVKVVVPPGTPIVTPVPATRSDLKPGVPVFITAVQDAGGNLSARFINLGQDGFPPPM